MSDQRHYAGYADTHYLALAAELAREDKRASYAAMRLAPGMRVLDAGCGPGHDTIPLAELVGQEGSVAGVDSDAAMVAEAERRAAEAGVAGRVRHVVADAAELPFAPESFEAARAERLFQHLPDPRAALAEMVRVVRPGGWLVVLETDYSTMTIDADDIDLERRLARFAAGRVRSGYVARALYRMFHEQGLADVSVEVRPQTFTRYELVRLGWLAGTEHDALAAGVVSTEELDRWHAALEAADRDDAFFASLNHVIVAGRRP